MHYLGGGRGHHQIVNRGIIWTGNGKSKFHTGMIFLPTQEVVDIIQLRSKETALI